jgi:hypothetical protein
MQKYQSHLDLLSPALRPFAAKEKQQKFENKTSIEP